MRQPLETRLLALCVISAILPLGASAASADQSKAVQAAWKPQEIRYSYVGFTTAYNCNAFESKMKAILMAIGSHPETEVRATGCNLNQPSRNFFVTITTATPVASTDQTSPTLSESQQQLIKKLGGKSALMSEPFPAAWKTVELSPDRVLDLQPGDCELMEALRDHVLPKFSVKIVADEVTCTPRKVGIQTPRLEVSALVPLPSADVGGPVD